MKKILFAALPLLAACGSKNNGFVPGTYVHHAESKFSVVDDTLFVKKGYSVIRHAAYLRKEDKLPRGLVKTFEGNWQEDKAVLELLPAGVQIRFLPEGLAIGNIQYRRL